MNTFDLIRKLQDELQAELDKPLKDPRDFDVVKYRAKQEQIVRMIELVDEDNQILYGKGVGEIAQKNEDKYLPRITSEEDEMPF